MCGALSVLIWFSHNQRNPEDGADNKSTEAITSDFFGWIGNHSRRFCAAKSDFARMSNAGGQKHQVFDCPHGCHRKPRVSFILCV